MLFRSEEAKLFLTALGVFFPVYINTFHGVRTVDAQLIEMGRSYGMSRSELFRRVILPGALPSIFVGLRYGLGIMWLTLIVAETIAASSGIGQVTALKVAQAGGIPVLVARGKDKLEETRADIELRGGRALVYPCDLSDLEAIDALCEQLCAELPSVDFVVNNAGRSIRRSLKLSHDRFHDFERTMQLNYFGAIRLVIGLIPAMRASGGGHVVNVSSIGVQTNPPRFSAYIASKAALDAWSNVVSSELIGEGITFTGIHMPLVRTPMIAPTKIYDKFPTISPAQAADLLVKAMVERPHEINTLLGNAGAIAHTVAPKLAFRVLNMAYHVFPDSAAARGQSGEGGSRESEQLMLARVFKGIHW